MGDGYNYNYTSCSTTAWQTQRIAVQATVEGWVRGAISHGQGRQVTG